MDEREHLIFIIQNAILDSYPELRSDHEAAEIIADAIIASGWPVKA